MYALSTAKRVLGLMHPADEREKDKLEDLHQSILVNDLMLQVVNVRRLTSQGV
jgi:hypothetical protein